MKRSTVAALVSAVLVIVAGGCASPSAEISISAMSAPARAAVQRLTEGGQVEKITLEKERGRHVYDVEASVAGKHVEFLLAKNDGEVLGTETQIELNELPVPVRAAAEQYFEQGAKLKAMKGVEYGETSYEVEGLRKGKLAESTFDPAGKRLE